MSAAYVCKSPGRVNALRDAALASPPRLLNGIQFLEVSACQHKLEVHFVHPLTLVPTVSLKTTNVEIRGGVRVLDPQVTAISWAGEVLSVDVATPGDFSIYTLRLVADAGVSAPPTGIDPALAQIDFRFKVDCPSDFDCQPADTCVPQPAAAPPIDYLARDYDSFRRLILDRMAALMPDWRERNPADLWISLAEAVAFRGDELSYYQDAVATEAYLGMARQRASVRRHTRLLDYAFHDGCNARVWVAFQADGSADGITLPGCDPSTGLAGTQLLTQLPGLATSITSDVAQSALNTGAPQPFELMTPVTLYTAHNSIRFYTWSDDECCLPKGATSAFLFDDQANRARLRVGDVLILEATKNTTTGDTIDVDAQQRTAVRLTAVDPQAPLTDGVRGVPDLRTDPVTGQAFVEIQWGDEDALPFALCLSKRIGGALTTDMAAACANVGFADHGATAPTIDLLTALPGGRVQRFPLDRTVIAPLTQQALVRVAGSDDTILIDTTASATSAMVRDVADVRPALDVHSEGDLRRWITRRDLLASDSEATEFVVEIENDGHAVLRFGDGVNGRAPFSTEAFTARLRTGNGVVGNIGAEAIGHVVADGITTVRNPMPAQGGIDPQPMSQARLYAPQAFRRQERAVTADDYATMMELEPRVQRAVATRRWTGSWYTMFITVDRRGMVSVDAQFEDELRTFMGRYRLAGHDVEIDAPVFVPLDMELHVCTKPGYLPGDVKQRLLEAFSASRLPDGSTGFFFPDRFTFGQSVYLSAVIATAMAVPGVAYVTPVRFQRLGRNPAGEIASGRIPMARLEIARLDNDPNAPENGCLRFDVES
jgi:hypothetical protein